MRRAAHASPPSRGDRGQRRLHAVLVEAVAQVRTAEPGVARAVQRRDRRLGRQRRPVEDRDACSACRPTRVPGPAARPFSVHSSDPAPSSPCSRVQVVGDRHRRAVVAAVVHRARSTRRGPRRAAAAGDVVVQDGAVHGVAERRQRGAFGGARDRRAAPAPRRRGSRRRRRRRRSAAARPRRGRRRDRDG